MKCNDLAWFTFTNSKKMHKSLINPNVSRYIHDQGKSLFCWAFAISTMLRQSLKKFFGELVEKKLSAIRQNKVKAAITKLNNTEFHRQLR